MADGTDRDEGRAAYYYEQLFTIGVCGALAGVTLMLWRSNLLGKILHQKFHLWVVLGGFTLLGLVVLRAVAVWRSIDDVEPAAEAEESLDHDCPPGELCEQGHSHAHTHGHAHAHAVTPTPAPGGTLSLAVTPAATGHGHGHSHGHSHGEGHEHEHGWAPWRYVVLLLPVVLYFLVLSNPAFDREPVSSPTNPVDYIINFIVTFRSILWEALPFIVLGAVVAGLLEELLPQRVLVGLLPRNRVVAVALGGLLGLVFPMCECGIIPIMRRLLRKGLPLSCCIAYLLAGPIINVVVLLSTYAAFSGMENVFEGSTPSYQMGGWYMMGFRAGLGYLTAVLTALIVEAQYARHGVSLLMPLARPGELPVAEEEGGPRRTLWQRVSNISETALHDFVDITVFLILGALLAATARLLFTNEQIAELGRGQPVLAIALMMALAVALCLCSEADAFVAASFVTLRPSAKLAFLVLGPMLDFKLYFMYTRIFRPRLILTIYAAVVAQVFLYSVATHYFWEKNAPRLIKPQRETRSAISEEDRRQAAQKAAQLAGLLGAAVVGPATPIAAASAAGVCLLSPHEDIPEVRFTQLEDAATTSNLRSYYAGRRVALVGRFAGNEKVFSLIRYKINCCVADAQAINVAIFVDPSAGTLPVNGLRDRWVRVVGDVLFYQDRTGVWRTALKVRPRPGETLARTAPSSSDKARAVVEVVPAPATPWVD